MMVRWVCYHDRGFGVLAECLVEVCCMVNFRAGVYVWSVVFVLVV